MIQRMFGKLIHTAATWHRQFTSTLVVTPTSFRIHVPIPPEIVKPHNISKVIANDEIIIMGEYGKRTKPTSCAPRLDRVLS